MPKALQTTQKVLAVRRDNYERSSDAVVTLEEKEVVYYAYMVIAQAIDNACNNQGDYITIGLTRDKSAVLFTWHTAEGNVYAGGSGLLECLSDLKDHYMTEDEDNVLRRVFGSVTPIARKTPPK